MKNSLLDVHNMLMEELERLSDETLTESEENLSTEIKRAETITKVSQAIALNMSTVMKGASLMVDMGSFKGKGNMEHVLALDDPRGKEKEAMS